jgi:F-type H+-transporting ATPase subunit alpha
MAEITASNIDEVLRSQLDAISTSVESREIGTVSQVGDGIARVEGLRGAMAGELLEFETSDGSSVMGMALNLDEHDVGAVLLGDFVKVKENDTVKTTGRIVQVPSGEAFLGRIVGPLGNPIDGRGPITASGYRNVEHKAIGVVKKRETDFEKTLREYAITGHGIRVGEPLTDLRGILTGTPDMAGGRREELVHARG